MSHDRQRQPGVGLAWRNKEDENIDVTSIAGGSGMPENNRSMGIVKCVTTAMGTITLLLISAAAFAAMSKDAAKRLNEATAVLTEIRTAPDNGIPEQIWDKAECVVVIPSLKKAAFIVGGEFGAGVMSCRHAKAWSAPVFMQLAKGSAGFQVGAQAIDLVLVVMNQGGVDKLLGNKVTLGADASVAAGPVGRAANAATDAQMSAEMLAYSRATGLFAGVDISGGTLKPDSDENARAYGSNVSARDIALGTASVVIPAQARAFTSALSRDVRATTGVK
jgi:lipid-binding SYLF domain-containing protein